MNVIITYSDEAFEKLAAHANANSRTLEQYLRSNLSWAAKQFISVAVMPSDGDAKPTAEPLSAEKDETVNSGEPELYISDKPYVSKRKKKRKVKAKTPS